MARLSIISFRALPRLIAQRGLIACILRDRFDLSPMAWSQGLRRTRSQPAIGHFMPSLRCVHIAEAALVVCELAAMLPPGGSFPTDADHWMCRSRPIIRGLTLMGERQCA